MTCVEKTDLAAAVQVLRDLNAVRNLADIAYDIREREGEGWEGPKITKWFDAIARARILLEKYK